MNRTAGRIEQQHMHWIFVYLDIVLLTPVLIILYYSVFVFVCNYNAVES
jgi:hypothetical protein